MKDAYNRVPIFKGENYAYRKHNMYVHLMWVDKMLWVVIIDKPFIPKSDVDGISLDKPLKDWMYE